jgi:hypothetical protein
LQNGIGAGSVADFTFEACELDQQTPPFRRPTPDRDQQNRTDDQSGDDDYNYTGRAIGFLHGRRNRRLNCFRTHVYRVYANPDNVLLLELKRRAHQIADVELTFVGYGNKVDGARIDAFDIEDKSAVFSRRVPVDLTAGGFGQSVK